MCGASGHNYNNLSAQKNFLAGRNIYRILFKSKLPERNELFLPKRMAYVVDLDDEFDTDIPTTLIRSKADCPSVEVSRL